MVTFTGLLDFARHPHVREKYLVEQRIDRRRVGCCDIQFLVDLEAELVEVGRSDTEPTIVDGRLDMAHARVFVHADAVF